MNTIKRLQDFVRFAQTNPGEVYSWDEPVDAAEAQRCVHRMRVALSKIRNTLRLQRRPIKPFKMLTEGITETASADGAVSSRISLRYHLPSIYDNSPDLANLLELIAWESRNGPATPPATSVPLAQPVLPLVAPQVNSVNLLRGINVKTK